MEAQADGRYPCPCCGWLVFAEKPGSHEICAACGWEDDLSQLRFPTVGGGANDSSLIEAQAAYRRSRSQGLGDGHGREPEWRPLDPSVDELERPEPGRDYGATYAEDLTTYYYWRKRLPSR